MTVPVARPFPIEIGDLVARLADRAPELVRDILPLARDVAPSGVSPVPIARSAARSACT
jgi:hypothetical protein